MNILFCQDEQREGLKHNTTQVAQPSGCNVSSLARRRQCYEEDSWNFCPKKKRWTEIPVKKKEPTQKRPKTCILLFGQQGESTLVAKRLKMINSFPHEKKKPWNHTVRNWLRCFCWFKSTKNMFFKFLYIYIFLKIKLSTTENNRCFYWWGDWDEVLSVSFCLLTFVCCQEQFLHLSLWWLEKMFGLLLCPNTIRHF